MTRVPRGPEPSTPSRAAATAAVLAALGDPSAPRDPAMAAALPEWFDNGSGRPRATIDEPRVRRFVRARFRRVVALTRHPDVRRRHLAIWALGLSGDPRAARPVIAAHDRRANFFTHDFVFAAARRLGRRGVAAFERVAATTRGRSRDLAIAAIGTSGAGRAALPALRRIVHRHGCSAAVLNAVHNLHHPGGVGIALTCLRPPDETLLHDAVAAVLACCENRRHRAELPHRHRVVAALRALFGRPEMLASPGDPWTSTFAFAMEALQILDPRNTGRFAEQLPPERLHADRQETLTELGLARRAGRPRAARRS